ncbi:MAG: hypothetical protein WA005_18135 [Candidatus Binataceae bacterium]
MLRIQVVPRNDENVYHILRQKIDNEAKTFVWADKRKLRLKHVSPSHPGQIRMRDADGVLVADTYDSDQIVGAFVARLAAWFPAEIAVINIQVFEDGIAKKKGERK